MQSSRELLKYFNDNWTYCPISWEYQNVHFDVKKVHTGYTDNNVIAAPYIEPVRSRLLEVPIQNALKRSRYAFRCVFSQREGTGTQSVYNAAEQFSLLFQAKILKLDEKFTLHFDVFNYGDNALINGYYLIETYLNYEFYIAQE